jgi:hypothetical protein
MFDTAGSMGKLLETAALRGQIARFLHKHKNEAGRGKPILTEDTAGDEKSSAAALSRWDNEGGAVRDGTVDVNNADNRTTPDVTYTIQRR